MVVDVMDAFGVVTPHTIPITQDQCAHCGQVAFGGSKDLDASAAQAVAHIAALENDLISKLEKSEHPEIKVQVERAKARRDDN